MPEVKVAFEKVVPAELKSRVMFQAHDFNDAPTMTRR